MINWNGFTADQQEGGRTWKTGGIEELETKGKLDHPGLCVVSKPHSASFFGCDKEMVLFRQLKHFFFFFLTL